MMVFINRFKSENSRQLSCGILILLLLTYMTYGLAAGLQNRLSQNPLLIAVLFGIFIGNVFKVPDFVKIAANFTTTYLIKIGVVLIGLKISVQVIINTGYEPVLVAVAELGSVFLVSYFFLIKIMKLDRNLAILISAGCSICGAAAILTTSAVVREKSKSVTLAVTMITLMGTLQLFLYPYLYQNGFLNHFNDRLFGIFAGAGIYEFAQVYGAGYAVSDTAINFATIVKLIKVLMLIPVVFLIRYFNSKSMPEQEEGKWVNFPWFILFFILVVALNSMFTINSTVKFVLGQTGAFMFLMAMIALGLKTDLKNIFIEHRIGKLLFSMLVIISFTTFFSYFYTLASTVKIDLTDPENGTALRVHHDFEKNYYSGKDIFKTIGCEKCHVEALPTKSGGQLQLYSDLLIHDMGPILDDKITQGEAIGTDWRTTPLAGIGNRTRFLHNGSAVTYYDAIIAHAGEAQIVRNRFVDLNRKDKNQIYAFLDTLK